MPPLTVSSDSVVKGLEANGWRKEVAGDEDFAKACAAIEAMFAKGRGLIVTGAAGCGKTHLMKAIRRCISKGNGTWVYCKEKEGIDYIQNNDSILAENIYIDDIGCEEISKQYGNTVDAIGDFIQRYHYRGKGRFFATTNLNSQQINERYGTRCLDRLLEMCVVLKLNGKSKRERVVF